MNLSDKILIFLMQGLKRRGLDAQSVTILKIDSDRRNAQTERDDKLARRNALSKQVGEIKKQGGDAR